MADPRAARRRALQTSWQIIPSREGLDLAGLTCHAVTEFPTADGSADYALFVKSVLHRIIEARKVAVNPQNVLRRPSVALRAPRRGRAIETATGLPSFTPPTVNSAGTRRPPGNARVAPSQRLSYHAGLGGDVQFQSQARSRPTARIAPEINTRLRDYQRRSVWVTVTPIRFRDCLPTNRNSCAGWRRCLRRPTRARRVLLRRAQVKNPSLGAFTAQQCGHLRPAEPAWFTAPAKRTLPGSRRARSGVTLRRQTRSDGCGRWTQCPPPTPLLAAWSSRRRAR